MHQSVLNAEGAQVDQGVNFPETMTLVVRIATIPIGVTVKISPNPHSKIRVSHNLNVKKIQNILHQIRPPTLPQVMHSGQSLNQCAQIHEYTTCTRCPGIRHRHQALKVLMLCMENRSSCQLTQPDHIIRSQAPILTLLFKRINVGSVVNR